LPSNKFRIRDPVHGYIIFDAKRFEFLLNVIDSFEFQRLRRIKQLGTTYFVYPGAEHSRFGHSIGAMWLIFQLANEFKNNGVEMEEDLMSKMLLAALIHDVGHGPFSHVFEKITMYDHKEMTLLYIREKLSETVPTFSGDEIEKLFHKELSPENAWIGDLLDSQIDVDRMDFLLRDSLYTGVDYGRFDMQRVFHSLAVGEVDGENHLVMLLKGLHAFEGFFIAYHHMYWQVYFHKTTRACEILLEKIFQRIKELLGEGLDVDIQSELEGLFVGKPLELEEFFLLDDCTILETIKKCRLSRDKILSDLSSKFLNRKFFKCIKKEKIGNIKNILEMHEKIQKFYEKRGISHEYYFATDEPQNISVKRPFLEEEKGEKGLLMVDINKFGKKSDLFDFIDRSDIIRSLYNVRHTAFRMYCPDGLRNELREILGEG